MQDSGAVQRIGEAERWSEFLNPSRQLRLVFQKRDELGDGNRLYDSGSDPPRISAFCCNASLLTLELSRGPRRDSVCVSQRFSFKEETALFAA